MQKIIWVGMLSFLLSACTVGPSYIRPKVDIPIQYKETPKGWKVAQPQDTLVRGEWWKIFNDPQLNILEAELNQANQNIAVAAAQYRQARALVDEAQASWFPVVSAVATLTRQKQAGGSTSFVNTSANGSVSSGSAHSASSGSKISTVHALSLDAAWEPDLWGSVQRSVEAAAAGAQSSAASWAAVRLLAQATLAQTYFQLRALDKDQELLDKMVIEYQQALNITRHRYQAGVAQFTDTILAETQLDTARAQAMNNHLNRAQLEHALALLLGKTPANFSMPFAPLDAQPLSIPIQLPSQLLERRPDIAAAERLVAQANAQIGVAMAAYFPTVTLNGTLSEQNRGYAHWLSLPALNWSLGPQLAQTLFDGGLRRATTVAARENYTAQVAAYSQTVLAAFQEVEDNLVALRLLAQQAQVQNKAAAHARLAAHLVFSQYQAGTAAYAEVITTQTTAYTAEKTAADLAGLRMVSAVGLIKALGGGWKAE